MSEHPEDRSIASPSRSPKHGHTGFDGAERLILRAQLFVTVLGNVDISADGVGDIGSGGAGVGGAAYLEANGGSVSVAGILKVHADGIGAFAPTAILPAGAGTGGNARIDASDSGTNQGQITVSDGALLSATGQGGANDFGNGANGTGGTGEAMPTTVKNGLLEEVYTGDYKQVADFLKKQLDLIDGIMEVEVDQQLFLHVFRAIREDYSK